MAEIWYKTYTNTDHIVAPETFEGSTGRFLLRESGERVKKCTRDWWYFETLAQALNHLIGRCENNIERYKSEIRRQKEAIKTLKNITHEEPRRATAERRGR